MHLRAIALLVLLAACGGAREAEPPATPAPADDFMDRECIGPECSSGYRCVDGRCREIPDSELYGTSMQRSLNTECQEQHDCAQACTDDDRACVDKCYEGGLCAPE